MEEEGWPIRAEVRPAHGQSAGVVEETNYPAIILPLVNLASLAAAPRSTPKSRRDGAQGGARASPIPKYDAKIILVGRYELEVMRDLDNVVVSAHENFTRWAATGDRSSPRRRLGRT